MNQKFIFHLVTCLVACTLCASGDMFAEEGSFKNITFESVGYDTSTHYQGENVTLNFLTPYVESRGQVELHIIVVEDGIVETKINNATISSKYFAGGEYRQKTPIPTGLIDLGNNTISMLFLGDDDGYYYNIHHIKMANPRACKITLLEDSTINVTSTA